MRAVSQDIQVAAAPEAASTQSQQKSAPATQHRARAESPASPVEASKPEGATLPAYAAPAQARAAGAASQAATALFQAIEQRNAAALRQALAQGASPNTRNRTDAPALIIAVMQRWPEGVRLLLEAGADKAAKNNKGQTASDLALELGYADMTELLATSK